MTKDMKPLIEKRKYEKPAMQVYELKGRAQILAGSGGDIPGSDPYTPGDNPFAF